MYMGFSYLFIYLCRVVNKKWKQQCDPLWTNLWLVFRHDFTWQSDLITLIISHVVQAIAVLLWHQLLSSFSVFFSISCIAQELLHLNMQKQIILHWILLTYNFKTLNYWFKIFNSYLTVKSYKLTDFCAFLLWNVGSA